MKLRVADGEVDALLERPEGATAIYAMAHGAGAGMQHAWMTAMAAALVARGVAVLRFNLPYMQRGSKRVDPPALCHAAISAAAARAGEEGLPVFLGGKSFGGRMSSQAVAAGLAARGLIFLGFPLHPPDKPGIERAEHLARVTVPMLFLSGTRDEFAGLELLRPVVAKLPTAKLDLIEGADHGFKVKGQKEAATLADLAGRAAAWMAAI
jgi:predicted alpha/beta-hydrolase family hydrolase